MTRLAFATAPGLLMLAVVGAACSFSPATLTGSSSADAATADAVATADSAITVDSPPGADAPATDAAPEICPVASKALTLGVESNGNPMGPSVYEPSCTVGSVTGPADIWRVDLGPASNTDLVVEVTPRNTLDAIVDITQACMGAPGIGSCGDSGGPGVPEIAVVPFVQSGRRYIAVDSFGDSQGPYGITAFARSVVSEGTACSPDLLTSRCGLAHYCLDLDDDGTPTCEVRPTVVDVNANDDACATKTKFSDDGAYSGFVNDANDIDVVELTPTDATALRVVITDDSGTTCPADLKVELLQGGACETAAAVASDDNSGLGPCPLLTVENLGTAKRNWLKVSVVAGSRVQAGSGYTMVIDFLQ